MVPQLAAVFMLGAAQGVLGWYMVRSGLVDEPRVSQYRLAAHLSLAVVIYLWLLVLGLRTLGGGAPGAGGGGDGDASARHDGGRDAGGPRGECGSAGDAGAPGWSGASAARWLALTAGASIFVTLVAGAFVAGLKAGHVHPTFPKMGGFWVPPGMFEFSPWWRNLFEHPVTAQFVHRVLALASCLAVLAAGHQAGAVALLTCVAGLHHALGRRL